MWDWGGPATFAHDELTTDKRNPTANAYGPIYGVIGKRRLPDDRSARSHGDRAADSGRSITKVPPGQGAVDAGALPYWGEQLYWSDPGHHEPAAMDSKGRVWMSSRFRLPENQPAFCATHPSAALAPQPQSFRQIQYFDPKTRGFKQVDICFDVHHVQFAKDADETLYGNGPFSGAIGWVRTRVLDQTGDVGAAQGWCRPYNRRQSGRTRRSECGSPDSDSRDLQCHSPSQ
jgi:hypothetical protein